jgi:hypothetical protein
MLLRKFISVFTWAEEDRPQVVLGPYTRINPETHRAQLGVYGEDEYPTAADLYVKSRILNPLKVRQWLGFEAVTIQKKVEGIQVTNVRFRLSDGTNQYWWNGAWTLGTGGWNTEEEIAVLISTFPTTTKKLQVVVNLSTSDATETPELIEVKILFSAAIDSELEDLLERSLLPRLREEIHPVTRLTLVKTTNGNEIDLTAYAIDTDYRIVGVDAVFNHTLDPEHLIDLYESHTTRSTPNDLWHDETVHVITLNAMVHSEETVWVRVVYEPAVMIETSRDWWQLAHLPALVIEAISYQGAQLPGEDWVGNKSNGTAVVIPAPRQGRLDLELAGYTDKLFDLETLHKAVVEFFGNHYSLVSTGIDEAYRLRLTNVYDHRSAPNDEDLHTFRKSIAIENFRVWDKSARDDYLVTRFRFLGSLDATIEQGGS